MQVRVYVTLKPGVLDPAGKAVHHGLESLGFSGVHDVRIGRFFEIDLAAESEAAAKAEAEEMCKKLLANLVIERYRVEVLPGAAR